MVGAPTTVDVSSSLIGGDRSDFCIATTAPVLRLQSATTNLRACMVFTEEPSGLDRFGLFPIGQNLSRIAVLHSVYSAVRLHYNSH